MLKQLLPSSPVKLAYGPRPDLQSYKAHQFVLSQMDVRPRPRNVEHSDAIPTEETQ